MLSCDLLSSKPCHSKRMYVNSVQYAGLGHTDGVLLTVFPSFHPFSMLCVRSRFLLFHFLFLFCCFLLKIVYGTAEKQIFAGASKQRWALSWTSKKTKNKPTTLSAWLRLGCRRHRARLSQKDWREARNLKANPPHGCFGFLDSISRCLLFLSFLSHFAKTSICKASLYIEKHLTI